MHNDRISKEAVTEISTALLSVNKYYLNIGCRLEDLEREGFPKARGKSRGWMLLTGAIIIALASFVYQAGYPKEWWNDFRGIRCLVRNNIIVYEATRPIEDCSYCVNITQAITLPNLTRAEFAPHAYSSKPMVIKGAVLHWPAMHTFTLEFFKELYDRIEDSYTSVEEECQFLHFKSDFTYFKDMLSMSKERARNDPSQKSWYVGWGNCHPAILEEMRRHYPKPHFLPKDCEIPANDRIFMGYDDGATMHLDYIERLSWQAQLKGTKLWELRPVYECESVCQPLSFTVEPGDAVLVDTRIWYHRTKIKPGEFSISIQSEYG